MAEDRARIRVQLGEMWNKYLWAYGAESQFVAGYRLALAEAKEIVDERADPAGHPLMRYRDVNGEVQIGAVREEKVPGRCMFEQCLRFSIQDGRCEDHPPPREEIAHGREG